MIYLDGSALCRFLPGVRHYEAFGAWARDHIDELVTTQLGFTELRQAAELYPRSSAERVAGIVDMVRAGVAVIRFSDDNVTISSHATTVLKPFAALHVGAAVADESVNAIVTYDPALAHVASIYKLAVISPGLPEGWYLEYQGPSEHWKPVALDAPIDIEGEFDVPARSPRLDAYEEALRAARALAAPPAAPAADVASIAEPETQPALADGAASIAEPESDEPASSPEPEQDPELADGSDSLDQPESGHNPEPDDDAPDGDEPDDDEPDGDEAEKVHSEFEVALREAEAAAMANGASGEDTFDHDDDIAEDGSTVEDVLPSDGEEVASGAQPDGVVARVGTYRPRIEAWQEGDKEDGAFELEPVSEADLGDGLPWTGRPSSPAPVAPLAPSLPLVSPVAPLATSLPLESPVAPLATSLPLESPVAPLVSPFAPLVGSAPEAVGPEAVTAPHDVSEPSPVDGQGLEPTPALAPPAPVEPVGVPNLPREERGVPPVVIPSRESIGSAVRRPMFETDPHPDSRASRPPDPVPPVPPEESSPLTVPIKWNVELDEPEAYLPLRFDSESSRELPSLPVSFAGGQGGLTIESPGSVAVPALEPSGVANATVGFGEVSPSGGSTPMSARDRKAAEKAAKKERERQEKLAKKGKGPVPAPPVASAAESSEAWKLDDVLNLGPKKRGS